MKVEIPDIDDLGAMARTVFGEARGEPAIGQQGVAWVILNRARWNPAAWWGNSIVDVCTKPYQFSCYLPGANRNTVFGFDPDGDAPLAQYLKKLCQDCIDGTAGDPTRGATSYYAPAGMANHAPPKWARDEWHTVDIGGHRFYRIPPTY